MDNQVKILFDSEKFKLAFTKITKENNLSENQSNIVLGIFEKVLLAKIDYYDLAYELEQGLKIDSQKSIELASKMTSLYDQIVPQKMKDVVEKKKRLNESLIELPEVQPIQSEQLNSNYKQGKKFFKKDKLPDSPTNSHISPAILPIKKQEELLETNHNLKTSEFSPNTGLLLRRETKMEALGYTLRDQGLPEIQAIDFARKLVSFVEEQQRYKYSQKSLQRDVLEELGLVDVVGDKVVKWQRPQEFENISQSDSLKLKNTAFKLINILQAYTIKLLDKNAVIDKDKVKEYKSFLQIYLDFLAQDSLAKDDLQVISNNLLSIMTAIEVGDLLLDKKE